MQLNKYQNLKGSMVLAALLTLIAFKGFGQTPTITSISPTSGEIGTQVTISGTNFEATPTNNIVYFGGIQATVSSASATELTVEVPAGASHSQISVLVNGLVAYSSHYFNVTFDSDGSIVSGSDSPTGSFENSFRVTTTGFEWLSKAGDLDLDGKLDIVTADFDNFRYNVYQNTSTGIGDINFANSLPFPISAMPNEIELVDFDGDGKLDVAAISETLSGTSFFLQVDRNTSSGAGSFSFTTELLEGLDSYGWSIAYGDLNGDGKTDIVVEDSDNDEVSVFVNTSSVGAISFAAHVDFAVGAYPSAVEIADINADGLPEILTINATDNSVSILQNTSTGGVLSFAAKTDFSTSATDPLWLTTADLDGDGLLDVAVLNTGSISTFRNISTSSISLDAANVITTDNLIGFIEADDFNGDGKPDLLYTGGILSVAVVPNTSVVGTISFGTEGRYIPVDASWTPGVAGSADFDGDGEPDIVLVAGQSGTGPRVLDVMRNKSSGTLFTAFSIPEQSSLPIIDTDAKTITIEVDGMADVSSISATFTLSNFATAKVLGTSQISGSTVNDFTNPVTYTISAEDGSAVTDWVVTVTQECTNDEVTKVEEACGSYDFDGDRLTNSGIYVKNYLNQVGCDSTVTLELTIHPAIIYESVYAVDSYEFDGTTLTTTGQFTYGPFTASTGCDSTFVLNLTIEPDIYDAQEYIQFQTVNNDFHGIKGGNYLGDLDGDNDLDLIILGRNSNANDRTKVYLNEGDGTFVEKIGHGIPNANSQKNSNKLIDIDGDNDLDFLLFGLTGSTIPFSNRTGLYINDGSGNFTEKTDANIPDANINAIDVADVDGDNDLDFLIQGKGTGAGKIWLNDGNEVFSESPEDIFTRTEFGTVNFGDVDGDKDMDVFITGSTSSPTTFYADLYINDGTGGFSRPFNQNFVGIDYSSVVMVDLDNDGDLDLFTSGEPDDKENIANSIIYFNDGTGNFRKEITDLPEINGDAAFTDFDEDGDEDLVLSGWLDDGNSVSPRHTGIYLNNGFGNFTQTEFCALVDLGSGAISTGDLDNDGRKDLVINGFISESASAGAFVYLNKAISNYWTVEVCDSYDFNGTMLTSSGNYKDTYTDEYGCTYPVNLNLTILEPTISEETIEACDSYDWNGVTYTTSGKYQEMFTNTAGCDSTAVLNLTLNKSSSSNITDAACGSYFFDGKDLTVSGIYEGLFTTSAGCDSLVTLDLTIHEEPDNTITQNGEILFAVDNPSYTYQWVDCDNGNVPLVGETIRQLTPPGIGNFAVEISNGNCTVISDCFAVNWVTSTKDVFENQIIMIYPTVTRDYLHLRLSPELGSTTAQVWDMKGTLLVEEDINGKVEYQLTLPSSNGLYLIRILGTDEVQTVKRVIKMN